jgi:hypothetical protein
MSAEALNQELEYIIRELSRRGFAGCAWHHKPGEKVYVMTVLYHWIGVVSEVSGDCIVLKKTRLVYNTPEKIADFIKTGIADTQHTSAMDPEHEQVLQRAAIVNSCLWPGSL